MIDSNTLEPMSSQLAREAVVIHEQDGGYELQLDGQRCRADLALSCMILPERGDRVAIMSCDRKWIILAIVSRPQQSPLRLNLKRDVEIDMSQQKFHMKTQSLKVKAHQDVEIQGNGIHLVAHQQLKASANTLDWLAKVGQWSVSQLNIRGQQLDLNYKRAHFVHELAQSFIRRSIQTMSHSFRKIKGSDIIEADNCITKVKKIHQVHSKHSVQKAEEDMKIDGKRVHLG